MASQYPDCSYIGINLSSCGTSDQTPPLPNVKFENENIFENGLVDVQDNSIDYIHLRSAGLLTCLSQWPLVFKEINRILKSGGIIRIEELEHSVKDNKKKSLFLFDLCYLFVYLALRYRYD